LVNIWKATLRPGARIELSAFTAEVLRATPDGRPAAVDFRFVGRLDADELLLFRYDEGRLRRWTAGPPGSSLVLPREDFFATSLREAMRAALSGP
jgi:hypothetical protein